MKRFAALLLAIAVVLAFYRTFIVMNAAEWQHLKHAEDAFTSAFFLPGDPPFDRPEVALDIVASASGACDANVFRTAVRYGADDRAEILKYALLTTASRLPEAFSLEVGRPFAANETRESGRFMSTEGRTGGDQIAVLAEFGGNDSVSVRPLADSFDELPVEGAYRVEVTGADAYESFLATLVAQANARLGLTTDASRVFSADDFRMDTAPGVNAPPGSPAAVLLGGGSALAAVVAVLVLLQGVVRENVRIRTMKAGGTTNGRVWMRAAGGWMLAVSALSIPMTCAAAALVPGSSSRFVVAATLGSLGPCAIALVGLFAAYVLVARARADAGPGDRAETTVPLMLSAPLRVASCIALVLAVLSAWGQYTGIREKRAESAEWEHSTEYGVFFPNYVGYDAMEAELGLSATTEVAAMELYPVLNRLGALLLDAGEYGPGTSDPGSDSRVSRSVRANPNYLARFPLMAADGTPVVIPESTIDWIILVPERFRADEAELVARIRATRTGDGATAGLYQVEHEVFGRDVPETVLRQQVRVVWLADGQRLFSFDPSVNRDLGNVIVDPIVEVVTEANSLCVDRANVLNGAGGADPLKMRLLDGGAEGTLARLAPEFKRLRLDDNLVRLVTISEAIAIEVEQRIRVVRVLLWLSIGAALLYGAFTVQGVSIFWLRDGRRFVDRRRLGASPLVARREYFLYFAASWSVQALSTFALVALLGGPLGLAGDFPLAIAVMAVIAGGELAATLAGMRALERRRDVGPVGDDFATRPAA